MLRKIIFKTENGQEVTLPVTPSRYTVRKGKQTQTVDVYQLGAYTVPTTDARESISLDIQLPSSNRSYCIWNANQQVVLAWLLAQIENRAKLRFIVSGTAVNVPVYLVNFEYGEQDGTNDIYGTLTMQPYVILAAPAVQKLTASTTAKAREETAQQTTATTYTVKDGDNLWNICRKFYGDGSLCYKLAAYNGIKNANLIYTGQVLKIPDTATVKATAATQAPAPSTTAAATTPKVVSTKTKETEYTVRILSIGTFIGYASYSYINAKTGKSTFAEVGHGVTLTGVPAGSTFTVRWRSAASCYCSKVKLNARTQSVSGDSIQLTVSASQTLELYWAGWGS